ncbi:PD40 domain-containing protein [Geobacter sp. DSM 9736]|uniref:TolB family protein n=1 Tax=Geobacter sp. DSM 9736 TaxID=1277350 RepID=UPI000B50CDCC|nr:PD40 domain-containing protein [Geobacter sp. DSM 9736]SNB47901.1 WD40-like Beta Propeller Repeat [Geobacter sp. DSM 9736]
MNPKIVWFPVILLLLALSACSRTAGKASPSPFNSKSTKLATLPPGYEIGDIFFSPNGHGVAVFAGREGQSVVSLNGRLGKSYAAVLTPVFRQGADDFAHVAVEGSKQRVLVNGDEGKAYDSVGKPVFASNGRIIHEARVGEKWVIVRNGGESSQFSSENPGIVVASDGARFAYVEQTPDHKKSFVRVCSSDMGTCFKGKEYDWISAIETDRSGTRLFYTVRNGASKALVTTDPRQKDFSEEESPWYIDILFAGISDGGGHVAYFAQRKGRTVLIRDGHEVAPAPDQNIFNIAVSRTGRTVYSALIDGKVAAWVDGIRQREAYDEINEPSFSPDGIHFVYAVTRGEKSFIVVDGTEGPQYDKVVGPKFSPDGSRLVYRARRDGQRFVVIADLKGATLRELPQYEAVWDTSFSPDGKLVGYGVRQGNDLWWMVEKL